MATAIAALDAVIGSSMVLIGALVTAPLVSAVGAGWRRTGLVSAYALVLAVLLGFADGIFGELDHLSRVATVAVGGGLALWVAYLREGREQDSVRLSIQYTVARTLSECETLPAAAPRLLEAIGRPLGWSVGALWVEPEPGVLRCVETWCGPGSGAAAGFAHRSRELVLEPGMGVPGRVWQLARPAWVGDLAEDPRAPLAAEAGLHGAVGFPVPASVGVAGVMEFFTREARHPDEELLRLMQALGSQIGEFIEAVRAVEALRESEVRTRTMLESALDCVITIDHEGRIVEFNPAAERTFGYSAEEAIGQELAALIIPPHLRERHRSALGRYLRTGESKILGRRIELTGMRSDGSQFPVELAVNRIGEHFPPMFTGYVRDIADRKGAEEERERLLALERLTRLDATRARDQLAAILTGVPDAVTAEAAGGRLLFANDAAVRMLGYSSRDELLSAAQPEVMANVQVFDEQGRPFPLERLPSRCALRGEEGAEAALRVRARATGDEHWLLVKATPIFNEEGEVDMAINVFEDVTEPKREEREHRFLSESTRILASSLDPDETLQRIARLAVPDIADWCAVDLRRPDGSIETLATSHVDPAELEKARELRRRYPPDPHERHGVAHVLRTGKAMLYSEITDEALVETARDEEHLRLLREFGFSSAMVVPMLARGRTLGAITFVSGPSGRRFHDVDLVLAEELARRCAIALDNAHLFAERAYIAKTLQESLLPSELPAIPGLETAARFRASGDGNEVGGDFYDLFETGDRGWTVVVGDVCGKGPDAAAVTALARYTLRAAAMRNRLPSRSLRVLNEALLSQREDRRFCTVAYAYLESFAEGARLGFASGGHPLPLVVRSDGRVERLGGPGTVLGVVSDPYIEDRMTRLLPGDAVVFYTDGVTEAGGGDGGLDEQGLAELVASCAGLDADAIAERVEEAALRAEEGPPRDDIAVVVLRATG